MVFSDLFKFVRIKLSSTKKFILINIIMMCFVPNILLAEIKDTFKKDVVLGEQFSIVLENNKDGGKWTLAVYDPQYLEIVEDRKNNPLKTTVIFYPIETGTAEVRFNYMLDKAKKKEIKYLLEINQLKKEDIEEAFSSDDDDMTSTKGDFVGYYKVDNDASNTDYWDNTSDENTVQNITLAEELVDRGMYKEALMTLEKVKKDFPVGALPLELAKLEGKALLNLSTPNYDEAIERFKTYLESAWSADIYVEEIAEVHLRVGEIYFLSKDYDKSEFTYIEVISYYSDHPEILTKAYVGLSDVYIVTDRTKKAIRELETALDTEIEESVLEEVLIRLARIYFHEKEFKDYDLSYRYYNMLKLLFPFGKYRKEVVDKTAYLEENFINYGG